LDIDAKMSDIRCPYVVPSGIV